MKRRSETRTPVLRNGSRSEDPRTLFKTPSLGQTKKWKSSWTRRPIALASTGLGSFWIASWEMLLGLRTSTRCSRQCQKELRMTIRRSASLSSAWSPSRRDGAGAEDWNRGHSAARELEKNTMMPKTPVGLLYLAGAQSWLESNKSRSLGINKPSTHLFLLTGWLSWLWKIFNTCQPDWMFKTFLEL